MYLLVVEMVQRTSNVRMFLSQVVFVRMAVAEMAAAAASKVDALGSAKAALGLVEAVPGSAVELALGSMAVPASVEAALVLAVIELAVVGMAVAEVPTAYSPPLRYHP